MKNITLLVLGLSSIFIQCKKESLSDNMLNDQFYIRNNEADMPVTVRGNKMSKNIILYLHGGPGGESQSSIYSNSFLQLQEKYKIAFLDQRQQGNAHGHTKLRNIKFEKFTEDVYLLVNVLKKKYGPDSSIFILGHSWGGTLGTGFMINESYQKEVAGYIQVAGAYDLPLLGKSVIDMVNAIGQEEIQKSMHINQWKEIIEDLKQYDRANLTSDNILNLGAFAEEILINKQLLTEEVYPIESKIKFNNGYSYSEDPIYPKGFDAFSYAANAWAISKINYGKGGLLEEALKQSMASDLHKIKKPTLLIWGKYDFTVPPKLGEVALEKLGTKEKSLHIYEHSEHVPMDSDPDRFVKDVSAFIEKYQKKE